MPFRNSEEIDVDLISARWDPFEPNGSPKRCGARSGWVAGGRGVRYPPARAGGISCGRAYENTPSVP